MITNRSILRYAGALSVFCVLVMVLAGCPKPPEDARITITPRTATIDVGETVTFSATSSDSKDEIAWSTNNSNVATVNQSGVVTGVAAGQTKVVAKGSVSGATASATVTVVVPWEPDEFVYDVILAPGVVEVEESVLDALIGYDDEYDAGENPAYRYYFDAALAADYGLEFIEGDPLLVHGVGLGRIADVSEQGGQIIVETDFAPLTEIITDGQIAWDYGVEFTPEKVAAIEVPGKGIYYPTKGQPIEINLDVGDFNYLLKVTLDTDNATFDFTVSRDMPGPAGARFQAVGHLERFRSQDFIEIESGSLRSFDHQLNGLRGEATLELVVAASGSDGVNLEFPVTIMRVPFAVGPIPVVLNIRIQFVVNAVVPLDGSARVQTRFTYNSDLGLACDGVSVSAGGRMGETQFGDPVHETGASSPISANFGMGFPRVELSIAGNSVVPWAQVAFLVGGSYTVIPPCQTADATFLGAAGYKLGFFGLNLLSGSTTLFREDKELLRAGDCPKGVYVQEYEILAEELMLEPYDW